MTYDIAVVMPTIIQPTLDKAVKSVFKQDFEGRIQLLIGLDYPCGNKEHVWSLQIQAPDHIQVDVLDTHYSTRKDKGGLYYNFGGGALRTILTFTANAQYVAYLDDDCWYDPNHLSSLYEYIKSGNYDWAVSKRRVINLDTEEEIDGQFMFPVDTNCFMIDKIRCHEAIHGWSRVYPGVNGHKGFTREDDGDFSNALYKSGLNSYVSTGQTTVNFGMKID